MEDPAPNFPAAAASAPTAGIAELGRHHTATIRTIRTIRIIRMSRTSTIRRRRHRRTSTARTPTAQAPATTISTAAAPGPLTRTPPWSAHVSCAPMLDLRSVATAVPSPTRRRIAVPRAVYAPLRHHHRRHRRTSTARTPTAQAPATTNSTAATPGSLTRTPPWSAHVSCAPMLDLRSVATAVPSP
jgi:hypothetical protein